MNDNLIPWSGNWNSKEEIETLVVVDGRIYNILEGGSEVNWGGLRIWCSSVALARQLSKLNLTKLNVCEVGAGLGLVGMAASKGGAKVTFIEIDPKVCSRLEYNLDKNKIKADILCKSWSNCKNSFDLILGSEILYNSYELDGLNKFIADTSYTIANCRGSYVSAFPGTKSEFKDRRLNGIEFICDFYSK